MSLKSPRLYRLAEPVARTSRLASAPSGRRRKAWAFKASPVPDFAFAASAIWKSPNIVPSVSERVARLILLSARSRFQSWLRTAAALKGLEYVDKASDGGRQARGVDGADLPPCPFLVAHPVENPRELEADGHGLRPLVENLAQQHRGGREIAACAFEFRDTEPRLEAHLGRCVGEHSAVNGFGERVITVRMAASASPNISLTVSVRTASACAPCSTPSGAMEAAACCGRKYNGDCGHSCFSTVSALR